VQFEWGSSVLNSPASFMVFRMRTAIPIRTTDKIKNIFFFIGNLLIDYSLVGVRPCNSTLKEIAEHPGFHYATISRAIKRVGGINSNV
jgi:hypothetical protein